MQEYVPTAFEKRRRREAQVCTESEILVPVSSLDNTERSGFQRGHEITDPVAVVSW